MARRESRPWVDSESVELAKLAADGVPLAEIARRMDRGQGVIANRAAKMGIEVARSCHKTKWTAVEDVVLLTFYAESSMSRLRGLLPHRNERMIFNRATHLGLKKSKQFMSEVHGSRLQKTAQQTRFKPGHEAWNKGVKQSTGTHPNCRKTQFKRGERHGAAQFNYVPIGTERVRDGLLVRKVTDEGAYPAARWVPVSRIVWEAANGKIPDGHIVRFKEGQHTTERDLITPDRLELVSKAENMRRNSYHTRYPKEVAQLIQLKGAFNRKINNRVREAQRK